MSDITIFSVDRATDPKAVLNSISAYTDLAKFDGVEIIPLLDKSTMATQGILDPFSFFDSSNTKD